MLPLQENIANGIASNLLVFNGDLGFCDTSTKITKMFSHHYM